MSEEDLEKEWDAETNRIYDETYNKVYRNEMRRFRDQRPRPWYEAESQELATNMAEDAVKEYLSWLTRPPEIFN